MTLFGGIRPPVADNEHAWLNEWYAQVRVPLDKLPYTREWEELYGLWRVRWGGRKPHRHQLWTTMSYLRKARKLVTLAGSKVEPTAGKDEGMGKFWPSPRKGS